jgi:hypothetical protein
VYSITVRGLGVHEMVLRGESMWQVRRPSGGQAPPAYWSIRVKAGRALGKHWSNTGQTLVRHWSDTGQTLVRHWANTGQTLVRHWSDTGQALVRHWSDTGQTLGIHSIRAGPWPSTWPKPAGRKTAGRKTVDTGQAPAFNGQTVETLAKLPSDSKFGSNTGQPTVKLVKLVKKEASSAGRRGASGLLPRLLAFDRRF